MRRHIISEIGFTLYDGDKKSPVIMRREKINYDSIEDYDFVMDAYRDYVNDEHYTKFGINIKKSSGFDFSNIDFIRSLAETFECNSACQFRSSTKTIECEYYIKCRNCNTNCTITHNLLKKDNEGNIRGYNINNYSCPCRTTNCVIFTRVPKGTKSIEDFYKMQPDFFNIPPPYKPPPSPQPQPQPKKEVGKAIFLGLCGGFATFLSFGLLGILYLPTGVATAVSTISSVTGGIVSGSNAAALIYSVSGAIGSGIATIQNGGECTVVGGTPSSTVTGVINTYGAVFDPKDRLFNYFPHQRHINFNDPFDYVNSNLC
jgi:hypothetical protein